ncbi:MAG: quinolinate synthase NadA [Bacteroidales bacterium]|nr:quinolinate synthase NadA [Bacteroidales bacterium]
MNKEDKPMLKNGHIEMPIDPSLDLRSEIAKMKKEKNAIILAHYYTNDEVQEIADYTGDSLGLSQKAAANDADIIVFAGVHFMAETAKILSPNKKVLIPDSETGCSLADSVNEKVFAEFLKQYPGYTVISYVNTTAEIKAMSDIVCTSSNAVKIVNSLPKDEKIIFGPDKNLGAYVKKVTGHENMVIWNGGCHVHGNFSVEHIKKLKQQNPEAEVLAHPECPAEILDLASYIGATSALLKHSIESKTQKFIIATEPGILYEMKKQCPNKEFYPVLSKSNDNTINQCFDMKKNTLENIYLTLKYELPEVFVEPTLANKALSSINRMLEMSK